MYQFYFKRARVVKKRKHVRTSVLNPLNYDKAILVQRARRMKTKWKCLLEKQINHCSCVGLCIGKVANLLLLKAG